MQSTSIVVNLRFLFFQCISIFRTRFYLGKRDKTFTNLDLELKKYQVKPGDILPFQN